MKKILVGVYLVGLIIMVGYQQYQIKQIKQELAIRFFNTKMMIDTNSDQLKNLKTTIENLRQEMYRGLSPKIRPASSAKN